jgi:periplasmic protein TonB
VPAYADHRRALRPRERIAALTAVILVQLALGLALLSGLRIDVSHPREVVQRLIQVTIAKPPPRPIERLPELKRQQPAAPKAQAEKLGGSRAPEPSHASPSVTPVVAIQPSAAPAGGGSGSGPAVGAGAGGGSGGNGYGQDGGGTDLEQVAGEITPRDYPRRLSQAGIGGVVGISFRVEPTGIVSRCSVTRSSGVPELDALTCRLIVQRFRYRPSTDRFGHPVADTVDGEHEWIPHR